MFVAKCMLFYTLLHYFARERLKFSVAPVAQRDFTAFRSYLCATKAPPKRHQRGSLWFSLVALLLAFGGAEGLEWRGMGRSRHRKRAPVPPKGLVFGGAGGG
jgi:hypothetical protein